MKLKDKLINESYRISNWWYRKTSSTKNAPYHRIIWFDSPINDTTVCGISLKCTECDYRVRPNRKCDRCMKSSLVK